MTQAIQLRNASLTPQAIVHICVGRFHRAHQAFYLDDLLAIPWQERWGECGVGLLPTDNRMPDALQAQDCLYTPVERSAATQTACVIGSMQRSLFAPAKREAVLEKLASPETRIVSLAITEAATSSTRAPARSIWTAPRSLATSSPSSALDSPLTQSSSAKSATPSRCSPHKAYTPRSNIT